MILNVLFNVLAIIFFVIVIRTLWVSTSDPKFATAGSAAIGAIIAAFCAVMGNPDRFQKISFSPSGGIVAEARQTIQQAQVTLDQLQKLASVLARGSLDELAFSGVVFSGMSSEEKFNVRNQIVERRHSIGVKEDDIRQAQQVWIIADSAIIEQMIENTVSKAKSMPADEIRREILQVIKNNGENGLPLPGALKTGWLLKESATRKLRNC
jgi:hypothetical protein